MNHVICIPLFGKQESQESILESWNQAKISIHVDENSELQTPQSTLNTTVIIPLIAEQQISNCCNHSRASPLHTNMSLVISEKSSSATNVCNRQS